MSASWLRSEILRVIDALRLTDRQRVATPADWRPGQACMVQPTVTPAEAAQLFPRGVETVALPSGKAYLRRVELDAEPAEQ